MLKYSHNYFISMEYFDNDWHPRFQGSFSYFFLKCDSAAKDAAQNFFRSAVINFKKQEKSSEIKVGVTAYHIVVGKNLLQNF